MSLAFFSRYIPKRDAIDFEIENLKNPSEIRKRLARRNLEIEALYGDMDNLMAEPGKVERASAHIQYLKDERMYLATLLGPVRSESKNREK